MTAAPIRALIVDDERLARSALRASLRGHPEIEVIGECENGANALAMLRQKTVDLLFLDIQMPELDGFKLLDALGASPMPAVIFVTAFDQYAVRAFEVFAIDYVLKPFDDERLAKAVARAVGLIRARQTGDLGEQVRALLEELQRKPLYVERLAVKSGERVVLLPVGQIEWVEADENYIHIHSGTRSHMARTTIRNFETLLDPRRFVRISRSVIVNLQSIRECRALFNGDQFLVLHGGHELKVSRGYRQKLQASLGAPL